MIVFISNYYNHHQAPVAEELYRLTNGEYRFIATAKMPEWRKKFGYKELSAEFVIDMNESIDIYNECVELINNADVVIIGSAPEKLLKYRKKNRKIILRYSERPLKDGIELKKYPFRLVKWNLKNPPFCPIYMLSASAYTAKDYAKFGLFRKKCYKWGYFTRVKKHNIDELLAAKKKNSILWAGRMIGLKHPEVPINLALRLKKEGYDFSMNLVGSGKLQDTVMKKVTESGLDDCVQISGALPAEDVIKEMEKSEIFLFTSDKREGWGAVLNESMSSGCAVVANNEIGSVPFLIEDNVNGIKYNSNDEFDYIYERIKYLLDNPTQRANIGKNAYNIMQNEWNPKVAAERLFILCQELENKVECNSFKSGPCSKAEVVK